MYPFVPRVMPDGSVLLNAYGCGFFRVTGIDTPEPSVENAYTIEVPAEAGLGGSEAGLGACGIPVIAGRY